MNRVVKDGCQPKFEPNIIPFPMSGVWSTPPRVRKEYNRTTEREMRRACMWEGMASWPLVERLQPLRGSGCRAEVWVKCLPARDWGVFALYEMSISPASVSWREEGDRGAWPGCQIPDLAVIGEHTWLGSPGQAMGCRRHAREREAGGKLTKKQDIFPPRLYWSRHGKVMAPMVKVAVWWYQWHWTEPWW